MKRAKKTDRCFALADADSGGLLLIKLSGCIRWRDGVVCDGWLGIISRAPIMFSNNSRRSGFCKNNKSPEMGGIIQITLIYLYKIMIIINNLIHFAYNWKQINYYDETL